MAVGVGEDGDFQLAVAAHFFNRLSKGREAKVDFVQIGGAFVGQAFARVDVDEVADEHIIAFGIGVNDLFAADDDFINALNRGFADADDFQALGFDKFFRGGLSRLRRLCLVRGRRAWRLKRALHLPVKRAFARTRSVRSERWGLRF